MKKIIFISLLVFAQNLFAADQAIDRKIIAKLIKQLSGGRVNQEMADVLAKKPMSIVYLKEANDLANKYSVNFCDVKNQSRRTRDEVDAVRHFIGASILSAYYGPTFTRDLLTAHERRSDTYTDENRMDLKNNEVGIQNGKFHTVIKVKLSPKLYLKKIIINKRKFESLIFNLLNQGQLYVLDTKNSRCANSDLYPNM
tara:strand:- start:94992 stop:95585 length:594 start_codon:yes stop_codon:yes gene_type:complete